MSSGSETNSPNVNADKANAHLETDHLLPDIGHRAVSGGVVTIAAQATRFALNFGAAAILARLLSPRDFGLVGMVLGITGLVDVFKELGLSIATIQRTTITQRQVSNLFWLNVVFSGFLTIFSASLSPLVAMFYRDPRVSGIMLALSCTFLLTGSTVQHQALLSRQMRFSALALIDVASAAIGFAVACWLAWRGFSYWALVIQQLVTAAFNLIFTWFASGWRPGMPTRDSSVLPMIRFGAHLSLADFLGQFSANCDNIVIGRFYGAAPLGLYTRANILLMRPLQQVLMPMSSVLNPVLSRLQDDPKRYRHSFLRAYDTLAVIVFSFSAMCFVLARPLVLVILGSKWDAVVPLFAAASLVALSVPFTFLGPWAYESQGRGQDQLRNHTITGAIAIAGYFAGLPWGPLGVIVATAIIGVAIRLPIIYYIAGRQGPVSTGDLWAGYWAHLPCWGAVFVGTFFLYRGVGHLRPILQLLVCMPLGVGIGVALMLLLPRPRASVFYGFRIAQKQLLARRKAA
ncbi:MAG TPA: lipopolysaccharide biosynthesis protein [Terracidiphilus sp.]|nr:lipopolysaccharide biosynthesis protein [Terracidiphilus sp.]